MKKLSILMLCMLAFNACQKEEAKPETTIRLAKVTQKDKNFKDIDKRTQITYEYDESRRFVQFVVTYLNSKEQYIVKGIYDNNQLAKLQITETDDKGKTIAPYIFSENFYDTKGRLVKNITAVSRPGDTVTSLEYSGNNTTPDKAIVMENGKLRFTHTFTWKDNNLFEMKLYGKDNKLSKVVTYTFDNSPNYEKMFSPQYFAYSTDTFVKFFSENNMVEQSITGPNVTLLDNWKIKYQYFYNADKLPVRVSVEDYIENIFYGMEMEYTK